MISSWNNYTLENISYLGDHASSNSAHANAACHSSQLLYLLGYLQGGGLQVSLANLHQKATGYRISGIFTVKAVYFMHKRNYVDDSN